MHTPSILSDTQMPKKKITISVDQDLCDWLKNEVNSEDHQFSSMSHAIEYCIAYLKKDREFKLADKRANK
jgi:Arc/MetJ-type ribon-helix-helix transcriptional regulator